MFFIYARYEKKYMQPFFIKKKMRIKENDEMMSKNLHNFEKNVRNGN